MKNENGIWGGNADCISCWIWCASMNSKNRRKLKLDVPQPVRWHDEGELERNETCFSCRNRCASVKNEKMCWRAGRCEVYLVLYLVR